MTYMEFKYNQIIANNLNYDVKTIWLWGGESNDHWALSRDNVIHGNIIGILKASKRGHSQW